MRKFAVLSVVVLATTALNFAARPKLHAPATARARGAAEGGGPRAAPAPGPSGRDEDEGPRPTAAEQLKALEWGRAGHGVVGRGRVAGG